MALYPVNLDIAGSLCVVIGGGGVASRKVDALLHCGAVVRVISPKLTSRLCERVREGLLQWQQRGYRPGDLAGARLVFAATDCPSIQSQIVAEASAASIMVNVIDRPEACTFQVPASMRQGGLLLTVATGGASPALAAKIRGELQSCYGPEYGPFLAMMKALRRDIVSCGARPAEREGIFSKLLDDVVLESIRAGQWDSLGTILQKILPPEIDIVRLLKGMQNYTQEEMS